MVRPRISREKRLQIPIKRRSSAPEKQKIGATKKWQTNEHNIYKKMLNCFGDSTPQFEHRTHTG
jgi:hypothetical protein